MRPAFFSPSLQPHQMAIECNGKTCRLPLGHGSWEHVPLVPWPLFRAKPTDPTATPGNPSLLPRWEPLRVWVLQAGIPWPGTGRLMLQQPRCLPRTLGCPRKRQRPGACPGAGEHWPVPSRPHLALAMRMQHFFRWAVLVRVEDTYSASITLSVFSLPV